MNDEQELELVSPATMLFVFHLGKGECHQKLTGICSLEGKQPTESQDKLGEAAFGYCPMLLGWMEGEGNTERKMMAHITKLYPVTLAKHVCGHYSFNDGQHRTCIAKKKGLNLLAEIEPQTSKCDICAGKHYSDNDDLR